MATKVISSDLHPRFVAMMAYLLHNGTFMVDMTPAVYRARTSGAPNQL